LAQAYEEKSIPGNQILAIRQIIEQRNASGKGIQTNRRPGQRPATAGALIRSLQRETERRQSFARRASLTRSRLVFVTNALRHLLSEERFLSLMKAEGVHTLPTALASRLGQERG
jgi:ParB family chromosome partitioning protein